MIKNKRAWVRILEAVVAIMLIIGFILYIRGQNEKTSLSDTMYDIEHRILTEAIANETIRNEILSTSADKTITNSFFEARFSEYNLNYTFEICNVTAACIAQIPPEAEDKEIYADNIIVSANPDIANPIQFPKKLSLFVWIL